MGKPDLIDSILQEVFDLLAVARAEGIIDGLMTAATRTDHTESYVHSVATITPMLQELGGPTSNLEKAVRAMLADPVVVAGDADSVIEDHLKSLRKCIKDLSDA